MTLRRWVGSQKLAEINLANIRSAAVIIQILALELDRIDLDIFLKVEFSEELCEFID
jgi:hypothetical protein